MKKGFDNLKSMPQVAGSKTAAQGFSAPVEAEGEEEENELELEGGKSEGMDPSAICPEALAKGTEHEMEHTTDPKAAQKIAMDHLAEDDDYYEKLEQMEQQSGKRGFNRMKNVYRRPQ